MDYKEKYEQALKIAQETYNTQPMYREWLERMFPELAESEGEKVRKAIIHFISHTPTVPKGIIGKETMLAWLEKQGNREIDYSQNHQDSGHPNGCIVLEDFNGGEGFYKLNLDYLNKKQVEEVEGMVRTWNKESKTSNENIKSCIGMCLTDANEQRFNDYNTTLKDCLDWLKKQGDQKPNPCDGCINRKGCINCENGELRETEQRPTQEIEPFEAEHGKYYYCIKDYFCGGRKQASKGDVIQALRGLPIMGLKDASEYFLPVNFIKCNSAWSEEEERYICQLESMVREKWALAEKAQDEEVIKNMSNLAFFLKTLNPNKKPTDEEMKTLFKTEYEKGRADAIAGMQMEWSEEDEIYYKRVQLSIEWARAHNRISEGSCDEQLNWLKSLRPQNRWKPSDGQMELLSEVQNALLGKDCHNRFTDFMWELKKLKEE